MGSSRFSRRRSQPVAVESLEGRALLTVVAAQLNPIVPAAHVSTSDITAPIHVDGYPVSTTSTFHRSVVQPKAHVKDSKASASDFANVGKKYLKVTFSSATRAVGWKYIKAAVRGDGKTLKNLGKSHEVKQVGQSFVNLGSSTQAKTVRNSVKGFGNSVSGQYHRLIK